MVAFDAEVRAQIVGHFRPPSPEAPGGGQAGIPERLVPRISARQDRADVLAQQTVEDRIDEHHHASDAEVHLIVREDALEHGVPLDAFALILEAS